MIRKRPSRSRARGLLLPAAAATWVIVVGLAPRPALAQIPTDPRPETGFFAGPVRLFPVFGVTLEHTDNVLYRSASDPQNVRPSNILTSLGGLVLEVPISNSGILVGVAGRDRNYSDDPSSGAWYALASARIVFGSGLVVRVRDEYEDGTLDTQAFRGGLPGVPSSGEIVFTGEPYRVNSVQAEVDLGLDARRRVAFRYNREDLGFSGDRSFGFYDLAGNTFEAFGEIATGGGSAITWSAGAAQDHLSRPDSPPPEGGGAPVYPAAESRQKGVSIRAGWERGFGVGGRVAITPGVVRAETVSDERFDYLGIVGSAVYVRDVPDRFYASAGYYRNVFPSPFSSGELFVSDSLIGRIARPVASRFLAGGEVAGTRNDYQSIGGDRVDEVFYVQAWVGYRWLRALQWRVYGVHTTRSSTDPDLDFDVNRIGTTLAWGF